MQIGEKTESTGYVYSLVLGEDKHVKLSEKAGVKYLGKDKKLKWENLDKFA
jgi:hypothetical protein